MRTLISKHNVNLNIRNNDGVTLLQEAISRGHFQAFKALVENGANVHLSDNKGNTALLIAAKKRKFNETRLLLEHGTDPNQSDAKESTPLMISSEKGHEEIVQEILSQGPACNLDADLQRQRDGINAVMLAATNGRTTVFRSLWGYGVDLSVTNNNGSNLLMMSAQNGHIDIVKDLLRRNEELAEQNMAGIIDPNQQNNAGRTALLFSAQNGHERTTRTLLRHGADPNIQDVEGSTPLIKASIQGRNQVVHDLLEHEANPDLQDESGSTALMYSSEKGDKDTTHDLLEHNAAVDIQNNDRLTALIYSSGKGYFDVARDLLKHNANPNIREKDGKTALMMAARYGNEDVADLLLDNGADIHTQDAVGFNPTMLAAIFSSPQMLLKLIARKPNLNAQNSEKGTALIHASLHGREKHVKILINNGANIHLSRNGYNALMAASSSGEPRVVEMLLKNGINPNIQTTDGHTALISSVLIKEAEATRILLRSGAEPNVQNNSGVTPLMIAAESNRTDSMDILLRHKANPDITNKDGITALAFAVLNDHPNAVKMLLRHGANPSIANEDGLTPLTISSVNGNTEITKMLLKHYARYHEIEGDPIVGDDSQSDQESTALKVQCFDALRSAAKHTKDYNRRLDYLTQAALLMSKLRSEDSYIVGQAINILSEDASKAATSDEKNQIVQRQKDISAQLSRLNRSASNASTQISFPFNSEIPRFATNEVKATISGLKEKIAYEFKALMKQFKNLVPSQVSSGREHMGAEEAMRTASAYGSTYPSSTSYAPQPYQMSDLENALASMSADVQAQSATGGPGAYGSTYSYSIPLSGEDPYGAYDYEEPQLTPSASGPSLTDPALDLMRRMGEAAQMNRPDRKTRRDDTGQAHAERSQGPASTLKHRRIAEETYTVAQPASSRGSKSSSKNPTYNLGESSTTLAPIQRPITPRNNWSDAEYNYHHSDGYTHSVVDFRAPDGSRSAQYWDSAKEDYIYLGESSRKPNATYQNE